MIAEHIGRNDYSQRTANARKQIQKQGDFHFVSLMLYFFVMKEKNYGCGPWEYRYICKTCGHTVRPPKNKAPCSRCGGDFGQRISMRKLYLEPEKSPEIVETKTIAEPTWWVSFLRLLGFHVEPRVEIRQEKRAAPRRWRWQTHTEVEEESGIVRHENFFEEETYAG